MSKILIIPDVHGRSFWKQAVEQYANECDRIIFLGDEVDPYGDENITRKEAINTLKNIIEFKVNNKDKTILLLGNHAAHYFIKGFPKSTRFDSSNARKIRELYSSHISLFKLAYEETVNEKKYLFTHAGLMNSWVNRNSDIISNTSVEQLNGLINTPRGISALGEMSKYRSWFGEDSGSIIWSDVREKIDLDDSLEYNIIPNADSIVDGYDYQIFGHTQQIEDPIITDKWACLDCRKAFILDENGTLIQVTNEKLE